MKTPTTIELLMKEWESDSIIDELEPGKAIIEIPKLHSKYLKILIHHKLLIKKLTSNYNKLKKLKWEYYSGDLNNPEDLKQYNIPEPMSKKVLRSDIHIYLDSDTDLNNLLLKKVLNEEIVYACESILKELHSRTFQIKSFIEYEKFIGGN